MTERDGATRNSLAAEYGKSIYGYDNSIAINQYKACVWRIDPICANNDSITIDNTFGEIC